MDLLKNPFYVLGATMHDDKRRILELTDDKWESSNSTIDEAKIVLTNPKKRLSAEFGWLPGLNPQRISEMISILDLQPSEVRNLEDLPALTLANLLAAGLIRGVLLVPKKEVTQWILELSKTVEKIDTKQTFDLLNKERSAAKFPQILNLQLIDDEKNNRRYYYLEAIKQALNQLPSRLLVNVVTKLVNDATHHGERHAPKLIDDFVDRIYENEAQEFLECERQSINKVMKQIRSQSECKESYEKLSVSVSKLEKIVKNWDSVAQPIQVSARSRGTKHNMSIGIYEELRTLAVDLNNKHGLVYISKTLTELMQTVFAEIDNLMEQTEEDLDVLNEMISRS